MAQKHEEDSPFTGFGIGKLPKAEADVFILVVSRDGSLTAAAYATERGAMAAAVSSLEDERDDEDEETGALEDLFFRAQRIVSEEGGFLEIVPSPIYSG